MTESLPSSTTPDTARATKRGRLLLTALLLAVFCFFALFQFAALPLVKAALSRTPGANLIAVKGILICIGAIAMLAGLSVMLYGRKILYGGQYPLPDAWLWRDTRVTRGRDAIKFGWLHIVTGLLICIMGIGLTLYLWRLLDRPTHAFNLSKDIIILPQKSLPAR